MTTVLSGQDSVSPGGMQPGKDVYGGYGAGGYEDYEEVKRDFPGKLYISVSPYVVAGVDCLDIETGDAVPADGPEFVRGWHKVNTNLPMIYANMSTMPSVKDALNAAGLPRSAYYLWVAEWDESPNIPEGFDGIQFSSTSGFDGDSFYAYMWTTGPVWPLALNSSGTQVSELQTRLNAWAKEIKLTALISTDGTFGPATEAAVKLALIHWDYSEANVALGEAPESLWVHLSSAVPVTPVPATVPDVVGRTDLGTAESIIKAAGFVARATGDSPVGNKGEVITQSPAAGATADKGSTVTLDYFVLPPVKIEVVSVSMTLVQVRGRIEVYMANGKNLVAVPDAATLSFLRASGIGAVVQITAAQLAKLGPIVK